MSYQVQMVLPNYAYTIYDGSDKKKMEKVLRKWAKGTPKATFIINHLESRGNNFYDITATIQMSAEQVLG